MAPIHQWPLAILRRWLVLPAVGTVCLLTGMAVGITQTDRLMLFLSLAVCVACFCKAALFYRAAARGEYTVLEGVCVELRQNPVQRNRKVKIVDVEDNIHVLALEKRVRLRMGYAYRFYLRQANAVQTSPLIPHDELLGYEETEGRPSSGGTKKNCW